MTEGTYALKMQLVQRVRFPETQMQLGDVLYCCSDAAVDGLGLIKINELLTGSRLLLPVGGINRE